MALAARTLLLVRHAESEHNARVGAEHASDSPLSERGRAQADALCERLERELDGVPSAQIALVSSDLQRCLQTLAPFAARRGLRVELEPALREPAQRAVATQVVDPEAARAGLWARFDNGSVTRVERSQGAAPTLVYLNRA